MFDRRVRAEVDRVGAGRPAAVVLVGVEHLHGERLPAARRAAVHEARPALAEAAEPLLDLGDELVRDRIAVRAEVLRVHRVRVVVVRVRVLDLDDEEAREARARPVLVELVRLLLLDAVVAVELEALASTRASGSGSGGVSRKPSKVVREVAVEDRQRVARLGMLVEALGQQHVRAEVHRPAPELRQPLALDPDVLDVLACPAAAGSVGSPVERRRAIDFVRSRDRRDLRRGG